MRIAVFGAGAVGGYFGGRLAEAGEDVVFIARGDQLRALRREGLRVDSVAGDFVIRPAAATDDPAEVGPADSVLVAVKTWQLPPAVKAMGPLVGPGTAVVPLLNGVGAPGVLAAVLGDGPVLGGLCGLIAYRAEPGHILHAGSDPWITFGELDGRRSDRVARLAKTLEGARGVTVTVSEDIVAAMWEKFMFITSTGGLGAATRAPFGVFRTIPECRHLLEEAMREVVAVARARGVATEEGMVAKALRLTDGLPPDGTSSMQRDIMAGRPSELEAWNGAVVRLGLEAGVPTPVHQVLYGILRPQELRARGEVRFPEVP
jgi:2-dehydropantoate 2-reductase